MQALSSFVPLILIILVFYFFIIRPQSKQQKQVQEMRDHMKVGDEVLTIGGFYGIIYAIDDKNVVLEMLPDFTKAMVVKTAISRVITEDESVLVEEDDDLSVPDDEDTEEIVDDNLVIEDQNNPVSVEEPDIVEVEEDIPVKEDSGK